MNNAQQPDRNPEKNTEANDEEIIDLTQVYENGEDETILDLEDAVEPSSTGADAQDDGEETAIPLLDVVSDEASIPGTGEPENEVIDLVDVAPVKNTVALEPEKRNAVPSTDSEDARQPSGEVSLNAQQLEAALARVIEKVYGERIEQLLIETIEKTIKQEISDIRRSLTDDIVADG